MTIPDKWTMVKLADVCSIVMGQAPKGTDTNQNGKGIPLIAGAGDFSENAISPSKFTTSPTKIVDSNTLVISIRATIGPFRITDKRYCLGRGVAAISPSPKITMPFLQAVMSFSAPALKKAGRGATFLQINRKDLEDLLIPLPPLEEQKRIAKILDQVSKSIEEVNSQLSKFDELIQAHFHQQFSEEFMITEPLGDVASLIGGKSIVAKDSEIDSKFKVLKVSAITSGKFLSNQVKNLPADYQPPRAHLIRPNDLLISRASGSSELVGATILVPDDIPENLALPDKIWRFDWKNSQSSPHFYEALLSTPEFKQKILHSTSGSGASFMKNISKANLLQIPVPKVSFQDQAEFTTFAMKVKTLKAKSTQKLQLLTELQASLQTRAFQGLL